MAENIIQVQGIVKTFPGVRALDNVHFELKKGEVHGIVGENGAGKSTLIHILGGVYQPDRGEIFLEGAPVRFNSPHKASLCGISIVFQELSLVPNLSVAENIFAHRQPVNKFNVINRRRLHRQTQDLLDLFEMEENPNTLVKFLSIARQQVVEILKAISCHPKVLILDEPTSSLSTRETQLLFKNIGKLKEQGLAIIYISHHLPEIFEICDRATVLRDGKNVSTFLLENLTESQLVKSMVGRDLVNMYGERCSPIVEEYFRVENAERGKDFENISFSLKRGEILGFAGLVGSGRTELARALFGMEPLDHGKIFLRGKRMKIATSGDAIHHGLGYITEDRKGQGLFIRMSVKANCIAPSLRAFASQNGFLNENRIHSFAEENRIRFKIATPDVNRQVGNLSGGNQQKVLLSMWMGINPEVLIVDEPTRGVDVGARSEIYSLLRELAAKGIGIIMISSDLLEILGMSDRIIVMRQGKIAGEFLRQEATEEKIIACAAGVEI